MRRNIGCDEMTLTISERVDTNKIRAQLTNKLNMLQTRALIGQC